MEIDRLLFRLCRRLLYGIGVQRQIILFPCLVDLFRGHGFTGKWLNSIICRRTVDGICPGLHICNELHLFRAKFGIQQFFQTAAILRNSIDHIHLFRGKVLISHLCFIQSFKDSPLHFIAEVLLFSGIQILVGWLDFLCRRIHHHAPHPLGRMRIILIKSNRIAGIWHHILIGALENIFYQPVFEVLPLLAGFQIQRGSFRILL